MPFSRDALAQAVGKATSIPTLPEVVNLLVRLANDPAVDPAHVVALVARDPGLSAQMLRLVNSVYYGLAEPVHNLELAAALLGVKTLRSLAVSVSVLNAFQQQDISFSLVDHWTHGAVSGRVARLIATAAGHADPQLAGTLGLLRHIGRLVMVESAPDETRAIVALARRKHLTFAQAARQVVDADDAEVGSWLASRWEMEPDILDFIRHQYQPTKLADPFMGRIFAGVDHVCALAEIRAAGDHHVLQGDPAAWTALKLGEQDLTQAVAAARQEAAQAHQLLC